MAKGVLVQQQAMQHTFDGAQAKAERRGFVGSHPLCPSEVANRIFASYEAGDLITACAWCHRIEIDGEWHLAPHTALAAIEERYTLSHSICPVCALGPAN
jgi:cytochrome c553